MFCTPPATTRSWVPLITPCAAKCTACCEEPHCRSIVTPGTWSGSPATSQAVRATSPAWEPMVSQQPRITSSTAPGSTPVRRTSADRVCAARSAEWTPARAPPRLPTGVRTASTMKASVTGDPVEEDVQVLAGDDVVAELAAGAVPADRDPDGVTDEAVGDLDVEVVAQDAGADAVLEQADPHRARLLVALAEVGEPLEGAEVGRLVLEDRHLVVVRGRSPRTRPRRPAPAWRAGRRRCAGSRRSGRTARPGTSRGSRRPSTPWSRSGGRGCRRGCRRRRRCRARSCS